MTVIPQAVTQFHRARRTVTPPCENPNNTHHHGPRTDPLDMLTAATTCDTCPLFALCTEYAAAFEATGTGFTWDGVIIAGQARRGTHTRYHLAQNIHIGILQLAEQVTNGTYTREDIEHKLGLTQTERTLLTQAITRATEQAKYDNLIC